MAESLRAVAERLAEAAEERGARLAVAESLTGGLICAELARAPDASTWFAGGVVAYHSEVKYALLGVPRGPVVSEAAARAMAEGVARLAGASHTAAVTGVGGPDPQDGQPVGTVWIGTCARGVVEARLVKLDGDPETICHGAALQCLLDLEAALRP